MKSIYLLLPALMTVFVSFLIVRSAAIALMMTGLDRQRAIFQALSAFSGTGFTTREAERITNHSKRRKIISWLMILGNAGIVTVIVTTTSSFMLTEEVHNIPFNFLFLIVGLYVIFRIASSTGLMSRWENFVEGRLAKYRMMEEAMVEDLLHLIEGHGLIKVILFADSHLIGKTLKEKELTKAGILVLGIERGNNWIPVPKPTERLQEGDRLIIYGPIDSLSENFRSK